MSSIRSPNERPTRSSQGNRPSPLKSCFHLCTSAGTDLQEKRSPRLGKPGFGETQDGRPATTGSPHKGERALTSDGRCRTDQAAQPMRPITETRSTARFNGVDGISMSHTGLWLDSRAFRDACGAAGAGKDQLGGSKRDVTRKNGLTEAEKFVVKRLKDTLIRRYISVQSGWQRLDPEQHESISLPDFVAVTSKVLRATEARMLFKLCDTKGEDSLNVQALLSLLHTV